MRYNNAKCRYAYWTVTENVTLKTCSNEMGFKVQALTDHTFGSFTNVCIDLILFLQICVIVDFVCCEFSNFLLRHVIQSSFIV
jgi:hypothetical protein